MTRRTGLTVAALERVGSETRKNLGAALHRPDIKGSIFDCDTNRIVDCLVEQLTDRKNPIGFITICLVSHPDPGSKIHAAAMKEHAAITGWLENYFTTRHAMPRPQKAANALMALLHGTYAIVLGIGIDAWESIGDTGSLLRYILTACSKEKTAVARSPERKGGRARRSRRKAQASDPVAARPSGDP